MTENNPKVPMADQDAHTDTGWKAQVLRLTAFLATPLDPSVVPAIWQLAIGSEPETDDNRPREGVRRQSGPFGRGLLEIAVAQLRVDWILSPVGTTTAPPAPYFGDFEEAMNSFRDAGQNWLNIGSPSILRLAVGAVILMPTSSRKQAYERLSEMLRKVQVDPVRSSELFYQINWPRQSQAVSGLQLNRLTRWSAPLIGTINVQISPPAIQSPSIVGEQYAGLECDHNTSSAQTSPFDSTQVGNLFLELCDLVSDNAKNGEVPTDA